MWLSGRIGAAGAAGAAVVTACTSSTGDGYSITRESQRNGGQGWVRVGFGDLGGCAEYDEGVIEGGIEKAAGRWRGRKG